MFSIPYYVTLYNVVLCYIIIFHVRLCNVIIFSFSFLLSFFLSSIFKWWRVSICQFIDIIPSSIKKVKFVVDSGYVKQNAYDPVRHMDSLIVVPISQVREIEKIKRKYNIITNSNYNIFSNNDDNNNNNIDTENNNYIH